MKLHLSDGNLHRQGENMQTLHTKAPQPILESNPGLSYCEAGAPATIMIVMMFVRPVLWRVASSFSEAVCSLGRKQCVDQWIYLYLWILVTITQQLFSGYEYQDFKRLEENVPPVLNLHFSWNFCLWPAELKMPVVYTNQLTAQRFSIITLTLKMARVEACLA